MSPLRARPPRTLAAALADTPTPDERTVKAAGARLSEKFPEWIIVTGPLPDPIANRFTGQEAEAVGRLAGTDWFRWFLVGWESIRDAQGESQADWGAGR